MSNDGPLKVDPLALLVVVLLFAEHLLFGANRQDLGLIFAVVQLLLLVGVTAVSRGADPPRFKLTIPAILLGIVFALGLFSLLPLGPPLSHPLWSYVPGAPASISLDPVSTRVELIKLAGLTALFLVGMTLGGRREAAEQFMRLLVYAGILYCLWAAVAWITDKTAIFGVPRPYGSDRLSASFLSVNTAGTLFACLTVTGFLGLLRPVTRERRQGERVRLSEMVGLWPFALAALLGLMCLLLSASRGALFALVASILLALGLLAWMKSSRKSLTGGFLAVVLLVLFVGVTGVLVGGEHTVARLASTDPLNNDRLQIFTALWPTVKASPWLGYGLGAYGAANTMSINTGNALLLYNLGAAHNLFIQWLLQQGWPGMLAMTGAVAVILAATVRGVARRSTQQTLGVTCLAICAVFIVHGLIDYALEVPSMAAFFAVILGLGFGIAERPSGGRVRR